MVRLLIYTFICSYSFFALADELSRFSLTGNPTEYSDTNKFRAYTKHSVFGLGSRYVEFPTLKNPISVRIGRNGNSVKGYSHPQTMKSNATNPKYVCTLPADTSAELVFLDQNYAAVRVNCPTGAVNGSGSDDVVFVSLNDVQLQSGDQSSKSDEDDSSTEAGLLDERMGMASDSTPKLEALPFDKIEGAVSTKSLVSQRTGNSYFSSTEEYLKCYPTKNQKAYEAHLRRAIEEASEEFTIAVNPMTKQETVLKGKEGFDPIGFLAAGHSDKKGAPTTWIQIRPHADVLKCIFRKESLFDPAATSPRNAAGLGQQITDNITEIKCLLYGCRLKGKRRRAEGWAKPLWDNYYQKINTLPPATKKYLMTNSKTGKACGPELNSKTDAYCPFHSIAATALYQVKMESILRKNYDKFKFSGDFVGDELIYVNASIAAGHNAGEGHVGKLSVLDDPEDWGKRLTGLQKSSARRKEVGGYFEVMKACIGGDKKPMFPEDQLSDDPVCHKDTLSPNQVPIPTPAPRQKAPKNEAETTR